MTRIEVRRRFVEQEQRCILRQGTSQQGALPFAGAQRTDAALAEPGQIRLFECARGGGMVFRAGRGQRTAVRMPSEQHELPDRVIKERRLNLRLHRAKACALHRGKLSQRNSVDPHLAPVKWNQTSYGAQQCAFAATIRPDHRQHLAAHDIDIDALQHFATSISGTDATPL